MVSDVVVSHVFVTQVSKKAGAYFITDVQSVVRCGVLLRVLCCLTRVVVGESGEVHVPSIRELWGGYHVVRIPC